MDSNVPVLEASNITKRYGAVHALTDASIRLHAGEVVALVGDNGAGKSTFAGVLAGSIRPTSGQLRLDGKPVEFGSPHDARDLGIEMVFQDLALAPDLAVAENMFLGRERTRGPKFFGWLDRPRMNAESAAELERLSIQIRSVRAKCRGFSGGQRQAVAIARAVIWSRKILLLDEPTAALGVKQQGQVSRLIGEASTRGLGVLLISHNMQQVLEVCDRVVVMYQGRVAASLSTAEVTTDEIVSYITGAALLKDRGAS